MVSFGFAGALMVAGSSADVSRDYASVIVFVVMCLIELQRCCREKMVNKAARGPWMVDSYAVVPTFLSAAPFV